MPLSTVHHSCHAAVVSGDPAADKQDPGSGEQGSDLMSAVVFASAQLPTSPSSLHAPSLTHNSEPNISICEPRLVVADIDTASTPAHGPAAVAQLQ